MPTRIKAQPIAVPKVAAAVEMTADEYRAMIELSRNADPDECEMCGS